MSRFTVALAFVLGFSVSPGLRAQEPEGADAPPILSPILSQILRDWGTRRERFRRVSWELEGTRFLSERTIKGAAADPGHDLDKKTAENGHRSPVKIRLDVDFENGRARDDHDWHGLALFSRGFQPIGTLFLYDGERRYVVKPKERNPASAHPEIVSPEIDYDGQRYTSFFTHGIEPAFYAVGVIFQPLPGEPDGFAKAHGPDDFEVLGEAVHDGRRVVVLKVRSYRPSVLELWVDLGRESAIVRRVSRSLDPTRKPSEVTIPHRETADGWMPSGWTRTLYGRSGALSSQTELRVVRVERNPELPIEMFRPVPKPGMIIKRDDKRLVYRGEGVPPLDAVEEWKAGRLKPERGKEVR